MAQTAADQPVTGGDRKSTQFNIRMSVENKEKVERAARAVNQSLTAFAEAAIVQRADDILERQERILLSDRDFERFVQIMSADAEPTETARREASEFRRGQWDGGRYRW